MKEIAVANDQQVRHYQHLSCCYAALFMAHAVQALI